MDNEHDEKIEIQARILDFRAGISSKDEAKRYILVDFEYIDPETKQHFLKTVLFDQTSVHGFRMLARLIEAATRLKGLGDYIEANLVNVNYDGLKGMDVKGIAKVITHKWDGGSVPSLGLKIEFVDFQPLDKYIGIMVPRMQEIKMGVTTNAKYV